jgi:anti-sigma factor RsiW
MSGVEGAGFDLSPDMLSGYLDDELDADERAAVESRLAESAEWRAELEEVRVARLAVRGLPRREAPPGFWDIVLANVAAADDDDADDLDVDETDRETVAEPVPLAPRRERRRMRWIAGAAAAVVAVLVAVVVLPSRAEVRPNVAAVVAQHGALGSEGGDAVSNLAPVGPFAGFRR